MKFSVCFGIFAALLTASLAADEPPFGSITLNGGRLEPVSMNMIESDNEHLNFCFARRYDDGSIYLSHSRGIHTVTERGCQDFSPDNGKTWQRTPAEFGGFNAYAALDGCKVNVSCWDAEERDRHTVHRTILSENGMSVARDSSEIELPFESTFRLHRSVVRTRDGRLLLPGYGIKKGASKNYSFVIESLDDGISWRYLSTIMEDLDGSTPEGPNETEVIELAGGDILAVLRVGSMSPLRQLRSTDGGKTWKDEGEIAPFCVSPAMRILKNGTLLIVTGRPSLYLLVDFTGTGKNYQRVLIYDGSGSSYASILETAPDEIMIIYDESDFGSWRIPGIFSRIMAMTMRVVKDDSIKIDGTVGKDSEWKVYYTAAEKADPIASRKFIGNYRPAGTPDCKATWEIVEIAERPQPVLRLVNHGESNGQQWATFGEPLPRGADAFKTSTTFRLLEEGEARPQFTLRIAFDNSTGPGVVFGWTAFALNEIQYQEQGKIKKIPFNMGTTFHEVKFSASKEKGDYSLTVDGKTLFTVPLNPSREISPGFLFGDGAGGCYGTVDMTEIGWKY